MTLNVKVARGHEYMYFQAGKESIYIGPKGSPKKSKSGNVVRALDYSRERIDHYTRSFEELLPYLPIEMREQYLTNEVSRLNDRVAKYSKRLPSKSSK